MHVSYSLRSSPVDSAFAKLLGEDFDMEFRQLRHFVAVADAGNFTRASEDVFVSQPALTRSIQNLEHEVGLSLLVRSPSGVVPTEEGEELLVRARALLNDWARAKSDITAIRDHSDGHLRIGIAALFTRGLMGSVLKAFLAEYPSSTVDAMQGGYVDLRRDLLEGGFDFLLAADPLQADQDDERLTFRPMMDMNADILGSSDHPLSAQSDISATDLAASKWAFFNRNAESTNRYLGQNGIVVERSALRSNSVNLVLNLVKSGEFLTVLAPIICHEEIANGNVVVVKKLERALKRKIGLYHLSNRPLRPVEEAFLEIFERLVGDTQLPS
ncbi:LysR family transcriptional regulator [Parasphingopyxis algicola]|uniref:LysR family transcriptional regulator n=1 Tax=Parasphingopyxis algicola TaxID=2026624 RepID=UPI0015A06048|nr:LysR family transcriptional regulator [Parasphingopyxis algicola]QLC26352.1 LysR family transcriptional regulator [Parasphingopyxis algicola]